MSTESVLRGGVVRGSVGVVEEGGRGSSSSSDVGLGTVRPHQPTMVEV